MFRALYRHLGEIAEREGAVADLVVFDPDTIVDANTFQEPTLRPVGIQDVVVAGQRVVADGRQLDARRPGRALLA